MKKVVWISAVIAVLLLSLLLTGWADTDDAVKSALRRGARLYASAQYEEALQTYEAGLVASPEHGTLSFNAAQAAYLLGDYEKAVEYYEKSDESMEKYLHAGNAACRLGDAASDPNQMMEAYALALDIYREGIVRYPREVSLKYNYELLLQKISESESEDENQSEDEGEESEEENEGEEGEQGEDQEEQEENAQEDQESQESQEDQEDQEGQEAQEAQEENDETEESSSPEDEEEAQEQAEIARILEMLESQEEESLKNNREVTGGKDGKYDW